VQSIRAPRVQHEFSTDSAPIQHGCGKNALLVSRWGVAKLVKAADFDSAIRGFESFLPSHFVVRRTVRIHARALRRSCF